MNNSIGMSENDTTGKNFFESKGASSNFNSAVSAWNGFQSTKSQSSIDRVKGWAQIIASICALCA